jgi:hypothetical protein
METEGRTHENGRENARSDEALPLQRLLAPFLATLVGGTCSSQTPESNHKLGQLNVVNCFSFCSLK